MDIYRVALIGHREVEELREVEDKLDLILTELIKTKEYVEFQLGRNGEFDTVAASCIKKARRNYRNDNSSMTLVLPYPVADIDYYREYYDDIIIPDEASRSHPKGAITKRNRWLIDNSDLLIAYVRRNTGGAARCLDMALRTGIRVITL